MKVHGGASGKGGRGEGVGGEGGKEAKLQDEGGDPADWFSGSMQRAPCISLAFGAPSVFFLNSGSVTNDFCDTPNGYVLFP